MLSFSRASSTTSPADALRGPGPLGAREGAGDVAAGRIERSARPLPVAGAGLDQAAQRLVCGAAPRAVLDGHLIARQADRAVDVADRTGPASSRTPYPTAEQAGPQVLRAPVAAALSSPPPDPLPGLAAALRGLTHEAARFPQLIIIYDQIPDRRRGRGFATGIHLNEALEWSKRPGPPQPSEPGPPPQGLRESVEHLTEGLVWNVETDAHRVRSGAVGHRLSGSTGAERAGRSRARRNRRPQAADASCPVLPAAPPTDSQNTQPAGAADTDFSPAAGGRRSAKSSSSSTRVT